MASITFHALNRTALIVRPKKPYIDWVNGLQPGKPLLNLDEEQLEYTIYLVEELSLGLDPGPAIREHYTSIFEQELAGWQRDPNQWPANLDLKTFMN